MKANEDYDLYIELRKHFRPIIAEELLSEILKSEGKDIAAKDMKEEDFSSGYLFRSSEVEHVIKKYIESKSL